MKTYILCLVVAAQFILHGCGNNRGAAIEASGTLEAVEVGVSTKVPGQIERICIQEGSSVKKGDTLALLDHVTLELQWRQAKGGVDLAEAQYRLLLNGARIEDVRQAEESIRQAESAFNIASGDFNRMKELFEKKTVTRKQYDDAESRATIAQAQWNSVKQNLQRLQRFARPEDLAAAKARLDQARASADLLKKQLSDATILAPVGGVVTSKPIEEGELAPAGGIIAKIARLEQLNLMIYVNETDLGKVKLGGSADIVIDTYPEKNFPGRVVYISPIAEFTPKNVQTKDDRTKLVFGVKLAVDNPDGILKAGMPADAFLK